MINGEHTETEDNVENGVEQVEKENETKMYVMEEVLAGSTKQLVVEEVKPPPKLLKGNQNTMLSFYVTVAGAPELGVL